MLNAPEQKPRAQYTFQIPLKLAKEHGTNSVTLIELTADEEIMATKRAQNDPIRLAYELAKQSVIGVDGKILSQVDGTLDSAWHNMHPVVRSLVMRAYGSLHQAKEDDAQDFLSSRQVTVA